MVVKRPLHRPEVHQRRSQHKQVEDLMRGAPDVELARPLPLGPPHRVQHCAKDVHGAVQDDEADAHAVLQHPVAVVPDAVDDGHDARQAEADEHGCAVHAPLGLAEALNPGHGSAGGA